MLTDAPIAMSKTATKIDMGSIKAETMLKLDTVEMPSMLGAKLPQGKVSSGVLLRTENGNNYRRFRKFI